MHYLRTGNQLGASSSPYTEMTDCELIEACRNRDHRAFKQLMIKYDRAVQVWISHASPDWLDGSDIAQEVRIKVWRSLGSLRRTESFKSWLQHVARSIAIDHTRSLNRRPALSIDSTSDDGDEQSFEKHMSDVSRVPDKLYEQRELDREIKKAIARLPHEFRVPLVLREVRGLAYSDIAEVTNTGLGTVKSRIARARRKIKIILDPYLNAA